MPAIRTSFVPLAPVQLVDSAGRVRPFGLGAAGNAARGAALAAAVAAMQTGDELRLGPGQFDLDAAITPPAGAAIVGRGARIVADLAGPIIELIADDITLDGLVLEYTVQAVGCRTDTPQSVAGLVLRGCRFETAGANATAVGFLGAAGGVNTEHHVEATLYDCVCMGGGTTGFGVGMCVDSSSRVSLYNCDCSGGADGALFAGDTSAVVRLHGGNYESPTDAVTSAGPQVLCLGLRARGSNFDLFGDGGALTASYCDVRSDGIENATAFPTAAAMGLLDDTSLSAQRTTLGLPGAASGGTVTANAPLLNLAQTWNNSGVTFQGIKLNVTNTASHDDSRPLEVSIGGVHAFSVAPKNWLGVANGAIRFSNAGHGIYSDGANSVAIGVGGSYIALYLRNGSTQILANGVSFGNNTAYTATPDVNLMRDGAANTLALVNGTNAQTYRVYNTTTSATNYERLSLHFASNVARIQTEKGSGGGTARDLALGADSTERLRILAAGLITLVLPTSDPGYPDALWNDGGTVKISDGGGS